MAERIRRIPIGEPFELPLSNERFDEGDTLELQRDDPEKFLTAAIVKQDGRRVEISLEMAQMLFRNGALG